MEQVIFRAIKGKKLVLYTSDSKGMSHACRFAKHVYAAKEEFEIKFLRNYMKKNPGVIIELEKGKCMKSFEIKDNETELEALERKIKELRDAQAEATEEEAAAKKKAAEEADKSEEEAAAKKKAAEKKKK